MRFAQFTWCKVWNPSLPLLCCWPDGWSELHELGNATTLRFGSHSSVSTTCKASNSVCYIVDVVQEHQTQIKPTTCVHTGSSRFGTLILKTGNGLASYHPYCPSNATETLDNYWDMLNHASSACITNIILIPASSPCH